MSAFNDSQKLDYLWKKVGYGVAKTAENSEKQAFNEAIPSPLLYRGDLIWTDSGDIPATPPSSTTSIVQVYKDGSGSWSASIECTEDLTSPDNQTWKTNLTGWIPTQFGDAYLVKVYVAASGVNNPQTVGTQLYQAGSGNDDTWFFDYQAGVLNFNGSNIPTQIATGVTGKSVYIVGFRYVGTIGVGGGSILSGPLSGNLQGNGYGANAFSFLSSTGNVNAGNILTVGLVSATGNVTGNYIIGNGSQLTGLPASYSNTNVATYLASGTDSSNIITTANVSGGNIVTTGVVTSAGTIYGSGLVISTGTGGNISSANVISANVLNASVSVIGEVLVANTQITTTGNVTGGNLIATSNTYSKLFSSTNTTLAVPGPGNVSGERIRLYNFNNPSTTNFAIGVEDHYIWNAVDATTAGFKWYGGNSIAATLFGNGYLTATGNVTGSNLTTAGQVISTGNITGGNVNTGGLISATGNITGGNLSGTNITGTLSTASQTNITAVGTLASLNSSGAISADGNVTGGNIFSSGAISSVGYIYAGTGLYATSDINGYANALISHNISAGGNVLADGFVSATGNVIGAFVTATSNVVAGNVTTTGLVSATANIVGGNIVTGGVVTATGNVYAPAVNATTLSATGNLTANNVTITTSLSGNVISASGNISAAHLNTAGNVSAAGNVSVDKQATVLGDLIVGNATNQSGVQITSGDLYVGNSVQVEETIYANNVSVSGYVNTNLVPSIDVGLDLGNSTHRWRDLWLSGYTIQLGSTTLSTTISGGLSVTGTITSAGLTGTDVSVSGNVVTSNVNASGTISATGNVYGNNLILSGALTTTGDLSAGNVTATYRLNAANISASSNITGGNINSNSIVGTELTINSTGNLNLNSTGNVTLTANTYINNVANPVQPQDAATKFYVDNATAGLLWKNPVELLANSNIGFSGATNTLAIDGHANLTSANNGYRLLLINESPDSGDGIYVYNDNGSNYTITRSTDADSYTELMGAAVFVLEGDTYGNTSWVQSNHYLSSFSGQQWVQFAGPGTYSGGTGISVVGTVINLSDTAVTPGSYGSSSAIPNFTVNQQGQLTLAGTNAITAPAASLTGTTLASGVTDSSLTSVGTLTNLSVFGNVNTANVNTSGLISSAGDVIGNNLQATYVIKTMMLSATGDVLAANVSASGKILATGNISTAGNVTLGGLVSATGNVTGDYIIGNGALLTGITSSYGNANVAEYLPTYTGNVGSGNIAASGAISATGNITGNYFIGNGSQLTGIASSYGNANVAEYLPTYTGNVGAGNVLVSGAVSATGNVTASNFVGSGTALTGVMADRGGDQNNWNSLTEMGVYTVNRLSWSGTIGTPLDSQVYVGLLEIKNSTDTSIEQIFYPGTMQAGNAKVQWNRANWSGTWTSWYKIVNDDQVVEGGQF